MPVYLHNIMIPIHPHLVGVDVEYQNIFVRNSMKYADLDRKSCINLCVDIEVLDVTPLYRGFMKPVGALQTYTYTLFSLFDS